MKKALVILFLCLCPLLVFSHKNWETHAYEISGILGFEENPQILMWLKYISSDMIDNVDPFYTELKNRHKGFSCKHRLLFHWGYDSEPWSKALGKKVRVYCDIQDLNIESNIKVFRDELRTEQKRRNAAINRKTEELFGFAHRGKDASYAYFFCCMAYNIHLIGDYTSDNSDLDGLQDLDAIVRSINNAILRLDPILGKPITKKLSELSNNKHLNSQIIADNIIILLKENIPEFIQNAQAGSIKRRIEARGFKFITIKNKSKNWFQRLFNI